MRNLAITAAVLCVTTFALAPAQAQNNDRMGPIVQNGQCKHFGNNSNSLEFYFWGDCPSTESRRGGVGVRTVRVTNAGGHVARHKKHS
jgi:hypothetical protein